MLSRTSEKKLGTVKKIIYNNLIYFLKLFIFKNFLFLKTSYFWMAGVTVILKVSSNTFKMLFDTHGWRQKYILKEKGILLPQILHWGKRICVSKVVLLSFIYILYPALLVFRVKKSIKPHMLWALNCSWWVFAINLLSEGITQSLAEQ